MGYDLMETPLKGSIMVTFLGHRDGGDLKLDQ